MNGKLNSSGNQVKQSYLLVRAGVWAAPVAIREIKSHKFGAKLWRGSNVLS